MSDWTAAVSRDEAIAELARHGLDGQKRDWALGETIAVTRRDLARKHGEIIAYSAMFYVRVADGLFVITNFGASPREWERSCGSLQEAIDAISGVFDEVAARTES